MRSIPRIEELAWAAGVFDGEGSTTTSGPWDTPHVNVPQSGDRDRPPEMLVRFLSIVGRGAVRGPTVQKHWKPMWRYIATGGNAIRVLEQLWPDLGEVKRQQAEAALARHRSHPTPFERIARSTGRPLKERAP